MNNCTMSDYHYFLAGTVVVISKDFVVFFT